MSIIGLLRIPSRRKGEGHRTLSWNPNHPSHCSFLFALLLQGILGNVRIYRMCVGLNDAASMKSSFMTW